MDRDVIIAQVDRTRPVLEYNQFRTGLSYVQVYHMIWKRAHKRRRGVLGKWREIKLKMYREYISLYEEE